MKSIKEKAEEYAFIKQGIDPVGIQFREFDTNKQDGFEAGAYYVLDAIEEATNICFDEELKNVLQQLKK
jgi:hypothetical protein